LIHKFHVVLLASHAALPVVTSKLRMNSVKILIHFSLPFIKVCTPQCSTFSTTGVYQKDERAQPGNIHSWIFSVSNKCGVSRYAPPCVLFCLSRLQRPHGERVAKRPRYESHYSQLFETEVSVK
jgi:hypothetical protein